MKKILDLLKEYWPRFGPRDPILAMEYYKQPIQFSNHVEENMFEIIEKDNTQDIQKIDPSTNIIMCTRDDSDIIKMNPDGTLSVITELPINLSGNRLLINSFSVLNFNPYIKISCPRGIKLDFGPPFETTYINTVYPSIDMKMICEEGEEIPSYLRYDKINFTMYVDMDQIKRTVGVIVIKAKSRLVNFSFTPIYYIGCHTFPNIDKVYWIKSTEIFDGFDSTF